MAVYVADRAQEKPSHVLTSTTPLPIEETLIPWLRAERVSTISLSQQPKGRGRGFGLPTRVDLPDPFNDTKRVDFLLEQIVLCVVSSVV
jgi:hypothetical protein